MVFLPPTLVASIYGMNFQFMPELQWRLGYPFALLLMLAAPAAEGAWFKPRAVKTSPKTVLKRQAGPEVNKRLEQYMVQASRDVLAKSVEHRVNMRVAAFMVAIERVVKVIMLRGVYA